MDVSTLRPGILVSLKTSIRGNIAYEKRDLEHKTEEGADISRWETRRRIANPEEFEAANKVRQEARAIISRICAQTAFGLLCPEADAAELTSAIEEAQRFAAEFNRGATITRIGIYVISGRVAADDVQAVRAINAEVRELLEEMSAGVERLDVKRIRDAADKARSIGQMLTPAVAARITAAIDAARKTAREIVKAGESAAQTVDQRTLRALTEARTAFLDLDEDAAEVAAPQAAGRAVDLASGDVGAPAMQARQPELF